ncbi:MAG: ATP-binding protein [Bacteroidales bacterium]|nr:ATP-binding protein [Bacteroidales bacterium]
MNNILRPHYLNQVTGLLDREMMLILVGQRRVGKSFVLRQVRDWIKGNKPEANVVYINKEDTAFDAIKTYSDLVEYAEQYYQDDVRNYLLIDEVQDIDGFENALRSFHTNDKFQIVATGSNAYMFSSELSTRLSGRYIEIPIYSLDYNEFLKFHNLEDSDESLRAYLRVGGLPALRNFNIRDDDQVRSYLQGVYNTVMMKDVIARNEIRNVTFVNNLASFVGDNIGKIISPGNIYKYLKGQGEKIAEATVSAYLEHLGQAFLVRAVKRYDIHGKRLFENNDKYYFSDHGLRNCLCGFNLSGCIEKVMENVVWHHLLTQGYAVTVGILRAGEIDFVAEKGSQRIYIQVAYLIPNEDTEAREFGHLLKIQDNYPKYVVSMDPFLSSSLDSYAGIHHVHLRDFLKMKL